MGYRTRYALRTVNPADDAHIRAEILKRHPISSPFCADSRWGFNGECKWYDCEKDCKWVSLGNLSKAFIVYGCGEDEGDAWELRCEGGRCTVVDASWDELDDMMIAECLIREGHL